MPAARTTLTPARQLEAFLAKYTPTMATLGKAVLRELRRRVPGATELVYDNYNALAIGFAPGEKPSEIVLSVALYPRWVSLFFMQAKGLPDPAKRLRGSGGVARHVVLESIATLDEPAIRALMQAALARAKVPIDPKAKRRLVIKSISAKQRPRRPA